jgi:hypothetical protein
MPDLNENYEKFEKFLQFVKDFKIQHEEDTKLRIVTIETGLSGDYYKVEIKEGMYGGRENKTYMGAAVYAYYQHKTLKTVTSIPFRTGFELKNALIRAGVKPNDEQRILGFRSSMVYDSKVASGKLKQINDIIDSILRT